MADSKGGSVAEPRGVRTVKAQVLRVGAQGDGVCRTDSDATVFAPFTLPGESVALTVMGERGEVVERMSDSAERVEPACPHFLACGGCALQHWASEPYLAWKQALIRSALAREGLSADMTAPFAAAPGTRRRLALHARWGEQGKVRLGYKARRSWSLVDIEVCPIADPRLQAALPVLRRLARPFLEHAKSAPTLHATWTETGLDVDVTGIERRSGGLSADARMTAAQIAAQTDLARVTLAGDIVYQARQPLVRLGPAMVALPPGGFLQAVAEAETAMADVALKAMAGAGRIADLFCGLGTFTFRLASLAPVLAADADASAIAALKSAAGAAPGLKSITAEARDLYRRPVLAEELKRVDAVLFDPPRAGAADQARQIALSKVSTVVGVSCEATSFARDARILADGGFVLETVKLIDQFLWSPHVELVGVFRR
jgi:23S rRNA (uracil1939-C5)-methyltransferase